MSTIVEDILTSEVMDDYLAHIGMPRRSGRYPWGSGEDPYQRNRDFLSRVEELKKAGWKETPENIMDEFGLTTGEYRSEVSLATNERRALNQAKARSLKDDGLSNTEIGKRMGVNESTVRGWLNEESQRRANKAQETAKFLKEQVDSRGMIDVGKGVHQELNISQEKLRDALRILEKDGYVVYSGGIPQATNPGQQTTQKVLCPPGTPHKDIYNYDRVHSLKEYISRDGGETYEKKFYYPESLDSKRLKIRYNEEGGIDKDGIVEIRRGVDDLSLGESRYSQVRILVDKTHYIKGMAVYSDDMPDGVDVIFNTNKKKGTPMTEVLKEIKSDPDNPFGSTIKDAEQGGQYWYDPKTGERVSASHPKAKLGLINKRADEGDWEEWQDALPSQFLAKQPLSMAKKQLNLAKADKLAEFDDICSLTNPTIKKHLLEEFADNCDAAAVNLKAAALPGQKHHVIIPINTLKDSEVYAPRYKDGTKLALIRYPHAGIFEIPIVTVNNKNALAKKIIPKDVTDAIGINSKVASQLSGADFDGDSVMAIPTHDSSGKVKIKSRDYLDGLIDFDPKTKYGCDEKSTDENGEAHYYRNGKEYRLMSKKETGMQMGIISNLITDMTLAGASDTELERAVRHSMVVIDAHKHHLDYKQSEIDNNIPALHKAYQGKTTGGASTIISRAKSPERVAKRQGSPHTNMDGDPLYDPSRPEGSKVYKTADDAYYPDRKFDKATKTYTLRTASGKKITYSADDTRAREEYEPVQQVDDTGKVYFTNKSGTITYKTLTRTQESTKMAEHDDAYDLVSTARHPMELAYADYANSMKSLANKARLEKAHTGKIAYSPTAAKVYEQEVKDLKIKLKNAELNAPKEREAQRRTNVEVQGKLDAGVIEKSDVKKTSQRTLTKYREEVGAISRRKRNIDITDREWEAIQAGAITESILERILSNTDADKLRQRATPRTTTTLSSAKIAKIKAYRNSNYSLNEIAQKLGVSVSTISKYIKGDK